MTGGVILGATVAGLAAGALQALPTLGASLLYQQGRYVPLWLPEVGMLAAYAVHATAGAGGAGALLLGMGAAAVVSMGLHRGLFRRLVEEERALEALLAGIGLAQVAQGLASLYADGLSQHYRDLGRGSVVATLAGMPLHEIDAISLGLALALVAATVAALRWTHLGLQVRAVLANRDLARSMELPVSRVDGVVIITASVLTSIGAIARAARFDLQPTFMSQPGLSVVAALVVAGAGRHVRAVAVAIAIEVLVAIVGAIPAVSSFQSAVPFVVLGAALLLRAGKGGT